MQSPPTLNKFSVLIVSGPNVLTSDGIAHEGKLWIVPKWLVFEDGTTRPEIMIRFDNLQHQNRSLGLREYTINDPIPKSVLDGSPSEGFEILSGNDTPLYTQEKRTLH
jgi:hypothetical protein